MTFGVASCINGLMGVFPSSRVGVCRTKYREDGAIFNFNFSAKHNKVSVNFISKVKNAFVTKFSIKSDHISYPFPTLPLNFSFSISVQLKKSRKLLLMSQVYCQKQRGRAFKF
jgi:hypothetical protein